MDLDEEYPVFKLPVQRIALVFDNLETFWRRTVPSVSSSLATIAIPNTGKKTRPVIRFTTTGVINAALTNGRVVPVNLFKVGNLQVQWKGLASDVNGQIPSGKYVFIDSETQTMRITDTDGVSNQVDVTRHYEYVPIATDKGPFPTIAPGGSSITLKHANISLMLTTYDEMLL